jgi:hypothetical protein
LTAYHEATRQPRATINLANASKLIDDRGTKMLSNKDGKRRQSGVREEDAGYTFVPEGFRIRFNNGEVIDFYADSTDDKDGWMAVLSDMIGRRDSTTSMADDPAGGSRARGLWCDLVFKREEALRNRKRVHSRSKSTLT